MVKKDTRKKVLLCPSQLDDGTKIEKKVDELLHAHSEVLQREEGRKTQSHNSLSFEKKPKFSFFIAEKNKIKPMQQVKNDSIETTKYPQHQLKTRHKTKKSRRNHLKEINPDQKFKSFTKKILYPLSSPIHQYITAHESSNQRKETKVSSVRQIQNENKRLKSETREREREARRLAKEYKEKLRLERLDVKRKEKEAFLQKKLAAQQAKREIKERELEAQRLAKEHKEKIRLEQMAVEKEKREEQKRKVLEKRKTVADTKEKEREMQRLLKEREEKEQLERLEIKKREKEALLQKKLAAQQAKREIIERELEAQRLAKDHEEKIRLEKISIEKERQAEEKRKAFEKKKIVAEAKKKEQEEQKLKKLEKEKKLIRFKPHQQQDQEEIRSQLGEELQRARLDRQQDRKVTPSTNNADSDNTTGDKERLIIFEDAIAQIKPEESSWLDEKIRSDTTGEIDTKKTLNKDSSEVFFDDNSLMADLSAKSKFESSGFSPDLKKDTFDEIISDGKILNSDVANKLKTHTLEYLGYSHNSVDEIDFYSIFEPFAYVEIIREKESLDKRYVLIEMGLSEEETNYLKFIKETLEEYSFHTEDLETKGDSEYLAERVDSIINEYLLNIDTLSKEKIMYYLEKDAIGLGRLEELMKDPNIEDISCDGSGMPIFLYHRRYGSLKSNVMFHDDDELSDFVVKLAQKCGKHISISEPMLDATMPDGSRIQMTLSTEVTTKGSTFTIRKFSQNPFSPPDLIEFHTMSSEMVAFMWFAVENGINALIAGGTAAGKTSTLNAISLFIPRESKIVSIEETREINLPHPNWIPGVARSGFGDVVGNKVTGEIDLYDLMKAALRQRPEYIIVGEIRGKEAYVLFQAMATGHTTYSTVHADSAQSLIHRLEGKPIEIPRIMLQSLDIVCIQVISRVKNKRARRCKQIIEIIDIDPTTKEILTNEVFHWDPIEDKFIFSGKSYILERIRTEKGIGREDMIKQIKDRTALLDWMNSNNIRDFKKVATLIARYVDNPIDVMKKIRNES